MITLYEIEIKVIGKKVSDNKEETKKKFYVKSKNAALREILKIIKPGKNGKLKVTEYNKGHIEDILELKKRLNLQFGIHIDASFCLLKKFKDAYKLITLRRIYFSEPKDKEQKYVPGKKYEFKIKDTVLRIDFSESGSVMCTLKSKNSEVTWWTRSKGNDLENIVKKQKKEAIKELKYLLDRDNA